ncbi:MAG: tRNA lysidine(34) synthetase TilS [Methylophaga sp.]|nr:tRNA lysidine(34) synthetase TilS [Methylophaga sp.]MAY16537.1 tRNA lysidine(34) synthetase TilS [Methylophaga sp.]HAO24609.1 tRNA lysidine(34) synthetase TilS [Methylophaga sp.]HCD05735.1 tRNA lysidine(34) synthetase TilS [Methylophaga sp.]
MDSHVLLHFLATHRDQFPQKIQVVHVDHQLQAQSANWAEHCQKITESLQLPFHLLKVTVKDINQSGMESAARSARYQAINNLIGKDDLLLTGQHLQDQAETLMLQLLRGAGTRGLGAMRVISRWQKMQIVRPFLVISREDLLDYAKLHQLQWIDDPSNQNTDIQRNFLRHQIWPLLQQRWPAINQNLARSAQNLQESQTLLDALAEEDLLAIDANPTQGSLKISELLLLNAARQRNVLRFFMTTLNMALPSRKNLQRILDEVCLAAADSQPQVRWHHYIARRYQNKLYLSSEPESVSVTSPDLIYDQQPQILDTERRLVWEAHKGQGISDELFKAGLSIRFRQGGEKIQLPGKTHHQSLKKLFQEWQIPVWQRDTIPLLFADQELVAIVGYVCAKTVKPQSDQTGWVPTIERISQGDFD